MVEYEYVEKETAALNVNVVQFLYSENKIMFSEVFAKIYTRQDGVFSLAGPIQDIHVKMHWMIVSAQVKLTVLLICENHELTFFLCNSSVMVFIKATLSIYL